MAEVALGWLQVGTATATACPYSLLSQPLQGLLKSKNTTGKITAQSNKKARFFPFLLV